MHRAVVHRVVVHVLVVVRRCRTIDDECTDESCCELSTAVVLPVPWISVMV